MDRWILHRLEEVIQRVREAYERYQFHVVYTTLYNFCTVDLSAFYLDVLKDRLYTSGAASQERRSAQSAIYLILDAMVRLMAPIMSFTAEEVWAALPAREGKEASVHLARFPAANPGHVDPGPGRELEEHACRARRGFQGHRRSPGKTRCWGTPWMRPWILPPRRRCADCLRAHREDMRAILIVSEVNIVAQDRIPEPVPSTEMNGLVIGVTKARGEKCSRCWIYSESVGADAEHPTDLQQVSCKPSAAMEPGEDWTVKNKYPAFFRYGRPGGPSGSGHQVLHHVRHGTP